MNFIKQYLISDDLNKLNEKIKEYEEKLELLMDESNGKQELKTLIIKMFIANAEIDMYADINKLYEMKEFQRVYFNCTNISDGLTNTEYLKDLLLRYHDEEKKEIYKQLLIYSKNMDNIVNDTNHILDKYQITVYQYKDIFNEIKGHSFYIVCQLQKIDIHKYYDIQLRQANKENNIENYL